MVRRIGYKTKHCRFFLVSLSFVLSAFLAGATSFGDTNHPGIQLQLHSEANVGFITLSQTETARAWKGDTLAVISWWNPQGQQQSQAVSAANGWKTEQQSADDGWRLTCTQPEAGLAFQMALAVRDDVLTVCIPSPGITENGEARLKSIRLLPSFGAAERGDMGYLVIPKDVGVLCRFNDRKPGEYDVPVYGFNNGNMPLFGMVGEKHGFAGIITSGQFDARLHVGANLGPHGTYSIDPVFLLRSFAKKTRLPDDLTVEYHLLAGEEARWLGIARRYRQYNATCRKIRPLRERVTSSPELAYSAQALEVRIRMGVKPVPTPVLEQTPENEPPIRVFLTFEKLRDVFDEFHKQGIDKAEFCIVGWHNGGHDGRFPQLFPVEQAFGGEEALRKAIAHGQSLGYQIVSHDDYDEAFRISSDWDEQYIRKNPDGQLIKGAQLAGGQCYYPCRASVYDLFVKRDLPRVRDLGFQGVHYNDQLSIQGPLSCYDPEHPATRRQDAEACNRILAFSKGLFGGVQSEGPLDFTAPVLDRVLYIAIHSPKSPVTELPYVDEMVPLYPAVYHGTLLFNLWNDCVNTEPGDEYYLKNIEYGGMPVAYFYGHFWLDPSKDWLGDRDLRYDDKAGLARAVDGLRYVYDDLQKLRHLQMEFIDGHKQLEEGVFETVYSNGESVVVNYKNTPYTTASGKEIPARGFGMIAPR